MACSTTSSPMQIKTEPVDTDLFEGSATSYQRYGTPMTSSPTGVDSTTVSTNGKVANSGVSPPPLKKLLVQNESPTGIHKKCNDCYDSPTYRKTPRGSTSSSSTPSVGPSPVSPRDKIPSTYEHFEGSHSSSMLHTMNEMRRSRKFVDIILVVKGKELPCHKVVICAISSYFSEILNLAQPEIQRHYITEASYEVVVQLLDFAYTSRITITDSNIQPLLAAASHFKFTSVRAACMAFLKRKINPTNCIIIEKFASAQGCTELAVHARSYAMENFAEVFQTPEFMDLSVDKLLKYISSDDLNVQLEETVYTAAMSWVCHDRIKRKNYLAKVLECVRLPLVRPQFLLDIVQEDRLVRSVKECEVLLDEARRFQLLADQRALMQSSRTQPRNSYKAQKTEIVVVVGGLNKDKLLVPECFYYSFPEIYGKPLAPLKVSQTAYSVATVNNNIFVTGGAFSSACNDVWMYVPSLDVWQQVAPLLEARYLHTSVGLGNYLYVAGGHDGTKRLDSVERYNPDSNTWIRVQPMLEALSSPSAVTCDGCLYVIGGAKGSSPNDIVSKVQCYNPTLNSWTYLESLPQPERGAVVSNLNGIVYVLGQHRRVYAYNRHTNRWKKMNNTNGGHLHGAAAVHKGRLYIAGGLHGNNYINGTVEMYDQLNDSWCVVSTLHTPVYAQGFVSIYKDLK
ncbi:kelch-like protein 21 [Styela clava]